MRAEVTIYIGGVYASREPRLVGTLLGSCITACLRDPVTRVGGMNHFMLPAAARADGEESLSRFGVHAMELLIGQIQKLGGGRGRLEAKVFGGAHVLDIPESTSSVPQQNIQFIRQFLQEEEIPLIASDLGGRAARQIVFDTASGTVRLKRLPRCSPLDAVLRREGEAAERPGNYGQVRLFRP